jgi:hypothetical protein
MMITIKFTTGEQMRIEADNAKVLDGVLILFVYDKDRTKLHSRSTFRANTIDWARLDNGTVLIGEPDGRFRDRRRVATRLTRPAFT